MTIKSSQSRSTETLSTTKSSSKKKIRWVNKSPTKKKSHKSFKSKSRLWSRPLSLLSPSLSKFINNKSINLTKNQKLLQLSMFSNKCAPLSKKTHHPLKLRPPNIKASLRWTHNPKTNCFNIKDPNFLANSLKNSSLSTANNKKVWKITLELSQNSPNCSKLMILSSSSWVKPSTKRSKRPQKSSSSSELLVLIAKSTWSTLKKPSFPVNNIQKSPILAVIITQICKSPSVVWKWSTQPSRIILLTKF